MAFYTNSSMIGVDLNTASTTQLFALGAITYGSDGSIWQYVVANGAITAYSACVIGASGTAFMAARAQADTTVAYQWAVSQIAIAAASYGWVPVHGGGGQNGHFKCIVSGSVSTGISLYVGAASGNMSITSVASGTMQGIGFVTGVDQADTTYTAVPCIITWPKARTIAA